jgi:hypothetical protein
MYRYCIILFKKTRLPKIGLEYKVGVGLVLILQIPGCLISHFVALGVYRYSFIQNAYLRSAWSTRLELALYSYCRFLAA